MDLEKNIYIESLSRKGIALCKLRLLEKEPKADNLQAISQVWKILVRFVDPSDSKVGMITINVYKQLTHIKNLRFITLLAVLLGFIINSGNFALLSFVQP